MRELLIDIFWISIVTISVALNFHLLGLLFTYHTRHSTLDGTGTRCKVGHVTPDRKPVVHSALDLDGLPHFTGALSHVILEVDGALDTGPDDEVEKIKTMFAYWEKYPPCLLASHPTSWTFSQTTLTMLLRSSPVSTKMKELRDLFNNLPTTVRACFKSFEIRHAGLAAPGHGNRTLEADRSQSRSLFSALLSNGIKLDNPNHALYINADCVPVQPNWLNLVDYRTRPPNEPYWMMGSIFRGQRGEWAKNLASFIHLSRYALYNLADSDFREWYLRAVKRYAEDHPVPLYDFGRWEMDIFHYLADLAVSIDFQTTAAKFRYTNTILNQWNVTVDVPAILTKDPDVAMVCGIVPKLTRDIPHGV